METLFGDIRLALRAWLKRPGFHSLIVITLALGIGANAVVFSVIDGVLLRPLPYEDSERLAVVRTELVTTGEVSATSSPPEFQDLRASEDIFESLGGIWARPAALTDDGLEPEDIEMGFVSAGLLSVFGLDPSLGRDVAPEEDVPNAPGVVVLSYGLWERRYGGDPAILGKTLEMDGAPLTIVGVMPRDFTMLLPPDAGIPPSLEAWVPWGGGYEDSPRSFRVFTVVGRLREGLNLLDARARLDSVTQRLLEEHGEAYQSSGLRLHLVPLEEAVTAHVRPALVVLWATAVFVLVIACANVANLLLVRATSLEHEYVVRRALGASRSQLFRQVSTEALLLTMVGGLIGALFAEWGVSLLPWLAPGEIPRLSEAAVDLRALAFLLSASLLCAAAIGLVSALHLSHSGPRLALRSRGESEGGRHSRSLWLRRVLLASEVGLAVVLLVGGGLLVRSYWALSSVALGYETRSATTFKLSLIDSAYPYSGPQKIAAFYRELAQRIGEMSGVEAAGATTELPLERVSSRLAPYSYESDQGLVEWDTLAADYRVVTPGWLEALEVPLLEGRLLEWTDDLDHPNVVVIDDLLARAVWPGESAVGKRLQVLTFVNAEFHRTWSEVVGVVSHVRHDPRGVGEEQIFLPHQQSPQRTMTFVAKTDLPVRTLTERVAEEVRKLEPSQPVHSFRPMEEYRVEALSTHRFTMNTLAAFALVALVLASLGVYGLMAFAVTRRTREIGLRMALGAAPRHILFQVLREGLLLAGPGIAFGLAAAFVLSRFLSSLLFEVTTRDPVTYVAVAAFLLMVAIAACYIPGRRASSLNPLEALREE